MDRANPHEQRTIHARESASIDAVQRRGKMVTNIFWIKLSAMAASYLHLER
jgi:hypothetical protein